MPMPPEPPDPGPAAPSAGGRDPLDLWLRRGLHDLYSAVAAEPVPADLLRLIEEGCGRSEQGDFGRGAGEPPVPQEAKAGIADAGDGGFEQRVRERAYFLWLEEGCPDGRALEHWMLAFTRQVAQEAYEGHLGQEDGGNFSAYGPPGSRRAWRGEDGGRTRPYPRRPI